MTDRARAWTTPDDVAAQVTRRWDDGRILAAAVTGKALFPLRLPVRTPRPSELGTRFDEVKRWIRDLEEGSRAVRGYGYDLGWTETANRIVGRNTVPSSIVVPTEDDALRLIRRNREAERFRGLVDRTLAEFPVLRAWLVNRPMTVVEHAADWDRVLAVLRWFRDHPRPGIYLRQLDVAGVDTKFVEARRGLLSQLLDAVLPTNAVDAAATGASRFERRYGLRSKPPLVRFRVLDPALRVGGFSDLTVPLVELRDFGLPVSRVFVTENEVNGLAFPDLPHSLVMFGLGYGVDVLVGLPWLHGIELHYWGDIDTHGFAILAKLRASLPHSRSLLMDRETLLAHRDLWVREDEPHYSDLTGLAPDEQVLFDDLRTDRLGTRVRLEQERINYGSVLSALRSLPG